MKKILNYFTALVCLFVLGNTKQIYAAEIETNDIANSTYVIGKCMFTRDISSSYNGSLSTDVIMLAAKTIESNNLEDMIIYYKNARGVWVNALTSETIDIDETIDIEYKNNDAYIETPELSNATLTACGTEEECQNYIPELNNGAYHYDLGINSDTYRKILDNNVVSVSVSGYEIYEKVGTTYTKVGEGEIGHPETIEVTVEPGERKAYVARVYATKTNEEKVYSDYSNEVVIDHSKPETPELSNATLTACGTEEECQNYVPELNNGKYYYDLGINSDAYRKILDNNVSSVSVSGYEVYEKVGTTYTKVGVGEIGYPETIEVTIEPGERKVFVARVYAINANNEKVYSEYSNEIVIDHSTN